MKKKRLYPLIALIALSAPGLAQTRAAPDSTGDFPARVKYRSTAETIAALPGDIFYLPMGVVGFVGRKGFTLLYEERIINRLRSYLTFFDGRAGIRLLSSSGVGSGGRIFFKDLLLGGDADFTTTFGSSLDKRRHHLFYLAWPNSLTFTTQFSKEPKRSFNGIGNASREADRTSFRQEDLYLQLTYQKPLSPVFGFGLDLNYHSTEIGPGKSKSIPALTDSTLAGFAERAHFVTAGLALRSSSVDMPGRPTRGNRILLRLAYNQSLDGDEFSHLHAALITEQFFELFYRRILSLRLGTDWRYAPGDNDIPFYELASLGGLENLRGYRQGRFQDRGTTFGTATYRFPVWRLVEGTVFYDVGRTLNKLADFSFSDWEDSHGGSIRLSMPRGLLGEVILARSSEKTRLLFNFKTTF